MPSVVAGDMIASSLRLVGALAQGETPNANEMADALAALNDMLEGWNTQSLTVYAGQQTTHVLTAGVSSYTIGPAAAAITAARPISIEAAHAELGETSYPMRVTTDRAEYDRIESKGDVGVPEFALYDAAFPSGVLTLWPVPDVAYTMSLIHAQQFAPVASSASLIVLPPGYSKAVRYALAMELAPEYGIKPRADVVQIAIDSKGDLMRANIDDEASAVDDAFLPSGARSGRSAFLSGR